MRKRDMKLKRRIVPVPVRAPWQHRISSNISYQTSHSRHSVVSNLQPNDMLPCGNIYAFLLEMITGY